MSDRLCMVCTNYRTAGIHNFPWRAGYHQFVKPHKHQFKLVKVTGQLFPVYYFKCSLKWCGMTSAITKASFFTKPSQFHKAMKTITDSVNRIQVRPPRMNPSSHFTVRTDGTIEDHTPWLDVRPRNNQHFLGVEGSWRADD